jgi:hypothetical protein
VNIRVVTAKIVIDGTTPWMVTHIVRTKWNISTVDRRQTALVAVNIKKLIVNANTILAVSLALSVTVMIRIVTAGVIIIQRNGKTMSQSFRVKT